MNLPPGYLNVSFWLNKEYRKLYFQRDMYNADAPAGYSGNKSDDWMALNINLP